MFLLRSSHRIVSRSLRLYRRSLHTAISASLPPLLRWDSAAPVESADTLPSNWYTTDIALAYEREFVFPYNWHFAAHISAVGGHVGSYVTSTIERSPYIIIRQADGTIKAFSNVCRHHAMTLINKTSGVIDECMTCPYHAWQYNIDGRLRRANRLKGIQEFRASKVCLPELPLRIVGPFILLSTASHAPSDDHLQAVDNLLTPSRYKELQFVRRRTFEIECNWKVFVDNYLDGGYHVEHAHKQLASALSLSSYHTTAFDRYSVQRSSTSGSDTRLSDGDALYIFVHPNLMINRYGGWLDMNVVVPTSATTCTVDIDHYADSSITNEVNAETQIATSLADSDVVQNEDIFLCQNVQRGLMSRHYDVGRYAPAVEFAMHKFHRTLYSEILERQSAINVK